MCVLAFVEKEAFEKLGYLSCSLRDGDELTYPGCSPLLSEIPSYIFLRQVPGAGDASHGQGTKTKLFG